MEYSHHIENQSITASVTIPGRTPLTYPVVNIYYGEVSPGVSSGLTEKDAIKIMEFVKECIAFSNPPRKRKEK